MMQDFALHDTGFLVTSQIASYLSLKLDRDEGTVPEEVQAFVDGGMFDHHAQAPDDRSCLPPGYRDVAIAKEILDELDIEHVYCSEFSGTATRLAPDDTGSAPSEPIGIRDEYLVYLPTKKKPELFAAAYSSVDDLVAEFRETLAGILPGDFDYGPYLVEIQGTYTA